MKTLEEKILCAPNITEGRQKDVIEAIASSINALDGVTLLDVDASPSMNRTVFNILGSGPAVLQAAMTVARAVNQLVDMREQSNKSVRPVLGALDACPFVPIKNATIDDCIGLAQMFAEKLADELSVPVYLYGAAASPDKAKILDDIRMEDYENLEEKLKDKEWEPDYGPAKFVPHWGATMVGARKFLINYNINMLATKEQAMRIALNIREEGRGSDQPGRLKEVQAVGWYSEEHNVAQVSTSISDYEVTPLHKVYEEVCAEAKSLNLAVVGSQVVGVIPMNVILATADHFIQQENLFILEDDQKIRLVVQRLGLNSISTFNAKERIIEYIMDEEGGSGLDGPLISLSVKEFTVAVGSRTVTPGATAVVTMQAALGAALSSMVGLLSFGSKKFESIDTQMRRLLPPLYKASRDFLALVDESSMFKFDQLRMSAISTDNEDEAKEKLELEQKVLRRCVNSTLEIAAGVEKLWAPVVELAGICNIDQRAELQVAAVTLETAQKGLEFVLQDYLQRVVDEALKEQSAQQMKGLVVSAVENATKCLDSLAVRKE